MVEMKIIKGNLVDCDSSKKFRIREGGYLVLKGEKIVGAYDCNELPKEFENIEVEDYGDKIIIPGLSDIHLHAPQFSFRGMGMDLELLDWLNTYTFPEESKYSDLEYAKKAYELFVDTLKKSYTTRACIFATLHKEATLLLMELLEESGLVTEVGKVNMDRNSPDILIESCNESIEETKDWIEKSKSFKNTKPIITPRFIPTCSDELMLALSEIKKETGYNYQSHLSENPSEIAWVADLCRDSENYLDAYVKRGSMEGGSSVIMAHCVYSDDIEMQQLKEHNIYVAHCPQSNTNLSSGIAPIREFMNRGIKVGLGSDIAAGYSISMLRIAAEAVGVSKLRWRLVDDSLAPLSSEEAFYLASRGGGSFFGKVGAFEEDFDADFVVVDDKSIRRNIEESIRDRTERMLYLSENCNIIDKYVLGKKITI